MDAVALELVDHPAELAELPVDVGRHLVRRPARDMHVGVEPGEGQSRVGRNEAGQLGGRLRVRPEAFEPRVDLDEGADPRARRAVRLDVRCIEDRHRQPVLDDRGHERGSRPRPAVEDDRELDAERPDRDGIDRVDDRDRVSAGVDHHGRDPA